MSRNEALTIPEWLQLSGLERIGASLEFKETYCTPRVGAAYLFVPVFSKYLRMWNVSVFSICSHWF